MAKNSIRDYSATNSANTDIQSIDISEGCSPAGINNAIREVMADLKDVSTGAVALESPAMDSLTVDTTGIVYAGGNVGIGTSSPSSPLTINASLSAPQFEITRSEQTNQGFTINAGGGNVTFDSIDGTGVVNGRYIFNSTIGSTTTERMRIDSTGNVGIGTSSPGKNLEVAASGGIPGIRLRRTDVANSDVDLMTGGGSTGRDFLIYMNQLERFRITSNGIITYNNRPDGGGGVNVASSASYNDTSNHTVGVINTQSFALITINTSNGATHIPVYRNGGAGVAYGGTMLDPDNQTWVALGTSITFNQPGSFPQTFVVSLTTGGSTLNVQRSSGSNAYSVYVQLLG